MDYLGVAVLGVAAIGVALVGILVHDPAENWLLVFPSTALLALTLLATEL